MKESTEFFIVALLDLCVAALIAYAGKDVIVPCGLFLTLGTIFYCTGKILMFLEDREGGPDESSNEEADKNAD